MEIDPINDIGNLITDEVFIKQGWERVDDIEAEMPFYYWILPLPKDNPDKDAPCLISSANDDWEFLGLPENTYRVEISNLSGLGACEFEEDIEELYEALCGEEILSDKTSPDTDDLY